MNAPNRINLSAPDMTSRERNALLDAFDSNWIAPTGPALSGFEDKLCALAGVERALAVNSGTSALHLAMLVLGIGPGDVVLCPTVTFVASANVIRYVGATPHFIDCDPRSGNMDPAMLEQALTSFAAIGAPPKAVMTVDLYGSCADYSRIEPLCEAHGIPIIEDAAESIGATHDGRPAGSFGTLAAFSFNGNKLVTTGGGGALLGSSEHLERAAYLAGQARGPELHFEHAEIGYAYRLSNVSAAIGSAQLDRLAEMIERTRAINSRYQRELGDIDGLTFINHDHCGQGNGWLTVVELNPGLHPAPHEICEALSVDNIEARPAWKPMHQQPLYRRSAFTGRSAADQHFARGLCLPSGSSMTAEDQNRVITALRDILASGRVIWQPTIDVTDARPQPHPGNPVTTSLSEQYPMAQ